MRAATMADLIGVEGRGAAVALDARQKAELLRRVELFAGLDEEALARVAEASIEAEFPEGHYIVQQGKVGSGLLVLATGSVRVTRGEDSLATFGPGDFFGELSVLDQAPRSASVVALEPTTCLGIASWDLLTLLEEHPQIAVELLRALAGRLRAADEHPRH
jgi:CRP/FNR family cyclic AMP-dependent transcriptional regulator